MPQQLDIVDGQYAVLNPTNNEENFADKWQTHPQRERKFFQWLGLVKSNLENALRTGNVEEIFEALKPRFGERIVEKAASRILSGISPAVISRDKEEPPHVEIRNPNKPWGLID